MMLYWLLGMLCWGINCWVNVDWLFNVDVVVVDESFMIDFVLMVWLFWVLLFDICIILVGDFNQLLLVEVGNVLGDILVVIDKSVCDMVLVSVVV